MWTYSIFEIDVAYFHTRHKLLDTADDYIVLWSKRDIEMAPEHIRDLIKSILAINGVEWISKVKMNQVVIHKSPAFRWHEIQSEIETVFDDQILQLKRQGL